MRTGMSFPFPEPRAQSPEPRAQRISSKNSSRFLFFSLFLYFIFAIQPKSIRAQTATRNHFTFHLYVDPIYGDDSLATAQNPDPTVPNRRPLMKHPSDTSTFKGKLQHAPYSFQTVGGALTWIKKFPLQTKGNKRLPWSNPDFSNNSRVIDYIVIHCLPGLYGPTITPPQAIDPKSGLRWNGEQFPLQIPQRVSIQGTSVLDTIFDARCKEGAPNTSIFHIGHSNASDGHQFEFTFIDGVTIRGARGTATKDPIVPRNGAGVLIDLENEVKATISNCVFTDNVVGIGIWQDDAKTHHSPIIVNNTFAWNQVGLWNGSSIPTTSKGNNILRVFNNIFDSSTPATLSNYMIGISDFEGLDSDDRTIISRNNQSISLDPNAYEVTSPIRANLGNSLANPPLTWPKTLTRKVSSNQAYLPRYNLVPITQPASTYGQGSANRKTLYINDIFRNFITFLNTGTAFHDFRLAPMAEDIVKPLPNPLINLGIDFGVSATTGKTLHTGNLGFKNGLTIVYSPGLPPASNSTTNPGPEDEAQLNAWDWDGNGFGNRRVADRRGATVRPASAADSRIDIGASESLELTISGYLTNTRIFSKAHASVASNTGNFPSTANLWFFNIPAKMPDGTVDYNFFRPWCNYQVDLKQSFTLNQNTINRLSGSEWFNQAITNPYKTVLGTAGNYTDGRFDSRPSNSTPADDQYKNLRFWFQTTFFTIGGRTHLPPFMRNLSCDIAPHLAFDLNPKPGTPNNWYVWWGESLRFLRPLGSPFPQYTPISDYDDIFKANPWFKNPKGQDAQWTDNPRLYYDPGNVVIKDGHLTPPLTLPQGSLPPSQKSFLFLNQRHPWIWYEYGPAPQIYTVNTRGYTPQPDGLPALQNNDWHGTRFNCELISPDDSYWTNQRGVPHNNLQTFLVVNNYIGTTLSLESSPGSNSKPEKNLGIEGKARRLAQGALKAKAQLILQKRKKGK